jgi:mono/diheme cytochrome c family protein/plastocyanin
MTDTPGREPEERLPARRPPSEPAPVERFTAPPAARKFELSPERAAQIVRQSASARWVGLLTVIVVILFTIIYYFYELGAPLGLSQARLEAEGEHQQVVAVERGYNLYQANCARCHGEQGEGGIGPILNDQMKLFQHLNEQYLETVLEVGGRFVCGNPKSLMPVWSEENGGPMNYLQIEDLIAFIRAPNTQEYTQRDPELNEPVLNEDGTVQKFRGWRDEEFRPDPSATPVPDCYLGTPGGSAAPAPSIGPETTVLELGTEGVLAYDKLELTAPADEVFAIDFNNSDTGQTHDVDIRQEDGQTVVQDQPTQITGPAETTYVYNPLAAGTYTFVCQVHPIPAMTGTLIVE